MTNQPLVSCLCITKNKLSILIKAIHCYQAQSYKNKELIILKSGHDEEISSFMKKLSDKSITYIQLPSIPELTLGELRNYAIEACKGDYFCVWDDDDWQHMDRLEVQVTATLNSYYPVSVLTNLLAYNQLTKQAYFTKFRLWEGTILCRKELFFQGIKYPAMSKSEDTSFLFQLLTYSKIFPVVSSVQYIYIYHGNNTWDVGHFNTNIFQQPLSTEASGLITRILDLDYDPVHACKLMDASIIPKEINHFHPK